MTCLHCTKGYKVLKPQCYLEAGWPKQLKEAFIRYHFGLLPGLGRIVPWLRKTEPLTCRLCHMAEENIIHVVCICPDFLSERRMF